MQPVLILNDNTLPESDSGRAWMPRFKTGDGKTIKVAVGKSISRIDNGRLYVERWIMRKRDGLPFVFGQGYESLDGTPIIGTPEIDNPTQPATAVSRNTCDIKKGFFTVEREGQRHLTFRFKTNRRGQTIIGVMHGQNNQTDYVWFGFATNEGINFWRSASRGFGEYTTLPISRDEAIDCFNAIIGDPDGAGRLYARESRRCMRCNRLLTTPESLNNGIGPECINFQFG